MINLLNKEEDKGRRKREVPDGLWLKCESCGEILYKKEVEKNLMVCSKCNFHFKVSNFFYRDLLLDPGTFKIFDENLRTADPLKFKGYKKKLKEAMEQTSLTEAVVAGEAKIDGRDIEIVFMEFSFIGGSMGSVVGERVKRAIERASKSNLPLLTVNASGGARMQEGILSLMQMAKTATALNKLKTPYISILTNPTTAGVLASYASLGDIVIAEPGALIGFAGPRVIKQTIKKELPEGFQRAEFMLEHGLIDMVVARKDLRKTIISILSHLC
ncbi:MAG: acetyl-CoA carboxylase, carboxyltransferase subunit beta [candidate division WOR-3 bacterium]